MVWGCKEGHGGGVGILGNALGYLWMQGGACGWCGDTRKWVVRWEDVRVAWALSWDIRKSVVEWED